MSVVVDVSCVQNEAPCLRFALKKTKGRSEDVFRRLREKH
mgnify:FL=1